MPDTQHKSFFLTRKVLALLPLALLGAGVWYFIQVRPQDDGKGAQPAAPVKLFGAEEKPSPVPAPVPGAPAESSGEGVSAARIPEPYDPRAGMDMQGPPEFKAQVTHALKLVWTADRDSFLFIRRNLYVVRNENLTGFYMENGRPVAALSADHAFRSVTWCAGILAHQAWHAAYEMAKKGKRTGGAPPPPPGETRELRVAANPMDVDYKGIGDVLQMEDRAFSYQLAVLKKVGAPSSELDPVRRRAPRDFHLAHDGNYTLKP